MRPLRCSKNVHCKRFRRFRLPQDKRYSEALQWYNYSLSFFKGGLVDPNLAKLQRNRASCFLQLKQLEKVRWHDALQLLGACWKCVRRPLSLLCTWSCVLIRQRTPSKKHSAVTPKAFSRTSASTRWPCWSTMWRKVLGRRRLWLYCWI